MSGGAPPADYLVLAEMPPDQSPNLDAELSPDEVGEHMVDVDDDDVDVDEDDDNDNDSPETGKQLTSVDFYT